MSNFLELRNLCKSYYNDGQKLEVISDLNLIVDRGELLAIIGPSGCGKSTLLQLIAGFLEPDCGQILRNNKLIKGPTVGRIMIFQSFNQLFPWKTVLGNTCFPLEINNTGNSKQERTEKAKEYLQQVGLEQFVDYYPHQLSGGMKQRVALARALAAEPEILLMDEPFGSLDSQTRKELQRLLQNIWQQNGMTVILVTHDIREAIILADRIAVLDNNTGDFTAIIENELTRPRVESGIRFAEIYCELKDLL